MAKSFLKFCLSGEISSNLVTLELTYTMLNLFVTLLLNNQRRKEF